LASGNINHFEEALQISFSLFYFLSGAKMQTFRSFQNYFSQTLELVIPGMIKPKDFSQGLAATSRAMLDSLHLTLSRDGQYLEAIVAHCPNLSSVTICVDKKDDGHLISQGLKYIFIKCQHLFLKSVQYSDNGSICREISKYQVAP
jgi:hypothetical protein